MNLTQSKNNRRNFIKSTGLLSAGILVPNLNFGSSTPSVQEGNMHLFGKREGYTDQISILVSMMHWMRDTVMRGVNGISQKELDFLLDDDSNSIGAMLMHLAATERYYQLNTFTEVSRKDVMFDVKDSMWTAASNLGAKGREAFKGLPPSYYLDKLAEVRDYTMTTLKKKDDSWLMESTNFFGNQPTNNYCKWFHVVEHESNHNGQIRIIKKRVV